ncbi:MAG: glycosyltransferase family 4 protein [Actinomycetota bacterium]|nr:glycosyltransferase family 4 protein [Actinomycetota bacterium]
MGRRVSVVVDSDTWGGAEVYARHLLRRAGANGWEPSLICSEPVAAGLVDAVAGGAACVVPLARHADHAPWVASALRRQAPAAVLVNLVDPASNAAVIEAATSVAPTVATLHLPGDAGSGAKRDRLRSLFRRLHGAIAPSADGARQLVDDLAVPAPRVVVVPNGVDVPEQASGPAGRLPPRVGALGRLTEQKGFDVLVDAVRSLVDDGLALDVVIGGHGRDGARLAAQARDLPVRFCGFVGDPATFLRDLDVFCLPSRREALPLALLEAMAAGLPCIATDVGGIREALGSAAVVVPPDDAAAVAGGLRQLLRERRPAADLGRRAHELVARRHDAAVMATRTFSVLRAALAAPRPAPAAQ